MSNADNFQRAYNGLQFQRIDKGLKAATLATCKPVNAKFASKLRQKIHNESYSFHAYFAI